jgi:hypothetical protein
MINHNYFLRSLKLASFLEKIVDVFKNNLSKIDSKSKTLNSNAVLKIVSSDLVEIGFEVEKSKSISGKIKVPVLFGVNGKIEKSFDADAYNPEEFVVLEVEAGRAVLNNQFLKDLFQACMMQEVKVLCIAVRNIYSYSNTIRKDFEEVSKFFDTLYQSNRLQLPLEGVLVIGY